MRHITLNNDKVALVSDDDYEFLAQWKWKAMRRPNGGHYEACRRLLAHEGEGRKVVYMSHVVMERSGKPKPSNGMQSDHRNRNTLDNTRENLRWSTPSQNCVNRRKMTNKTGVTSVYLNSGKFLAAIAINGQWKNLGRFETLEEAADIRARAVKKFYGEFAPDHFTKSDIPLDDSFFRTDGLTKANTTGYRGVSLARGGKKFRAYLFKDSKQIHLGVYDTEKDAAMAYNAAAKEHFGETAFQNSL